MTRTSPLASLLLLSFLLTALREWVYLRASGPSSAIWIPCDCVDQRRAVANSRLLFLFFLLSSSASRGVAVGPSGTDMGMSRVRCHPIVLVVLVAVFLIEVAVVVPVVVTQWQADVETTRQELRGVSERFAVTLQSTLKIFLHGVVSVGSSV